MTAPFPILSLLETRILAVLVEKQKTVPDTYPLSLNSLVAGCNQKTSRDPVLNASEAEVQNALYHLIQLSLVMEGSGSRVTRFEHNMQRVLQLPSESVAMLATLMLRGPQTLNEIRTNCERLFKFADVFSVQAYLEQLRDRGAGSLVVELPRRAGSRETRWAHLLSGAVNVSASEDLQLAPMTSDVGTSSFLALQANVTRLEAEVVQLKDKLEKVCRELGLE